MEEIAARFSQIKDRSDHLSLEKIVGEINMRINYQVSSLGNPNSIKGYSEICGITKN